MGFKFNNITIICRSTQMGWEKFTFSGTHAHSELINFAKNPYLCKRKEILLVEADGICLYSKLSSANRIIWSDLAAFFELRPLEVEINA